MPDPTSPFERIRRTADDGSGYWSARELASLRVLGFSRRLAMAGIMPAQRARRTHSRIAAARSGTCVSLSSTGAPRDTAP